MTPPSYTKKYISSKIRPFFPPLIILYYFLIILKSIFLKSKLLEEIKQEHSSEVKVKARKLLSCNTQLFNSHL